MVLPLLAIGGGTVALAGVALGVGIATPEDEDYDLVDSIELSLTRTGYITEGIAKGSLAALPPAILVVVLVSLSFSLFHWIACRTTFRNVMIE